MTRTNNFDGLRIIAASMVIIGHAYVLTGKPHAPFIWQNVMHGFALDIFFSISGYLVVKSFAYDPDFGRFLAKRALRIFPALIVVVILTTCVLGPLVTTMPLNDYFFQPSFSKYFSAIILKVSQSLPGVFETHTYSVLVNAPIWTIPIEFFLYSCVMFVGALSLTFAYKNRLTFEILWTIFTLGTLTAYICAAQLRILDVSNMMILNRLEVMNFLDFGPYFGIGGMIFIAERYTTRQIPVILLIVIAIILQIDQSQLLKIVAFVFTPIIAVRIGQASWPVMRDLGRWGDLSYGTYLYGFPVAQVLIMYYFDTLSLLGHIVFTLLISYVLGFFSWHLVEKYALRLKPKPTPTVS